MGMGKSMHGRGCWGDKSSQSPPGNMLLALIDRDRYCI